MMVPPGSLVVGSLAKVVRPIRDSERAYIRSGVAVYQELARRHIAGEFKPYCPLI